MAEDPNTPAVPPGPATPREEHGTDNPRPTASRLPQNAPTAADPPQWWVNQPTTAAPRDAHPFALVRTIWAVGTAVLMAAVWFLSSPEQAFWGLEVEQANSLADLNNESAEGAPQQTVVNGWHQADLTAIQIRQGADLLVRQTQIAALLLVLGIGISGDMALRALADQKRRRSGT